MSRTTRARAARRRGEDQLAALRTRQLGIAAALADTEEEIMNGFAGCASGSAGRDGYATTPVFGQLADAARKGRQPAEDPHNVTVHTIVEMTRAFPGMDTPTAARLLAEAGQAHREGPGAGDTLGVFLAEVRDPMTGALEAGARYRVTKIAHRVYQVTVQAVEPGRDGSPEPGDACPRCGAVSWGQTPGGQPECTRCLYVEE